jgi:hypothetical protein
MRQGILAATMASLVIGLTCLALTPRHDGALPRGFQSPVFAAELVRNASEVVQVYGTAAQAGRCEAGPRNAECDFVRGLRWNTAADFFFIAGYTVAFMLLARLLPGALGAAAVALAMIACVGDITENLGMFRAMADPATDAVALAVRTPSVVKWTALALLWLALAALFLAPAVTGAAPPLWRALEGLTGLGYLLGGLLCFYALLARDALVEPATSAVFLAGLLQLAIFWRDAAFLRRYGLAGT